MSVLYQQLLRDVALRMNALIGAQAAPLQTTYATAVLTSANFKSADWPFGAFKDAILMAEEDFAWAIASVDNHPWRVLLAALTASIPNGTIVPTTVSGVKIIGVYGSVLDSVSSVPLTEQPLEVIRRVLQETWRVYSLYYYKFDGGYLFHTRPNGVKLDVCIYDRTAQATAFDANGAMLLPDVLEPAIAARAVSLMTRDNSYAEQAAIYRGYSDEVLARIAQGLTSPPKSTPGPTAVRTSA